MNTCDDELRAEDLARRIQDLHTAGPANALLGAWAWWFLLVGAAWVLTGDFWLSGTALLAALTARAVAMRAKTAVAATMLPDVGIAALGTLIELLEWPSGHVRNVARWRIATLLRTLPPGLRVNLDRTRLACLYDALTPMTALRHPWFVESVLAALPSIADAQALPAVMRLVRMKAPTRTLRRIREAASSVLPEVEKRILMLREAGDEAGIAETAVERDAETVKKTIGAEFGARPQMRVGFLIAAYVFVVPYCLTHAYLAGRQGSWLEASVAGLIGLASTQLYRLTMSSRHRRMAQELMNEDNVESIGRLAEAAVWPDPRIRAAAISALTRLLPRLNASDSRLLTPTQRSCLYTSLNYSEARRHPELVAALLRALEQVGDMAAVPYVRSLAQMSSRSARLAAIREAAQQTLPSLMERARLNTDHQILLRPAEVPGPPEETLLRPVVAGTPVSEAGMLVRPAEPEPEEYPEAA